MRVDFQSSEIAPFHNIQAGLRVLSTFVRSGLAWQVTLRLIVGAYWIFFSYSKWSDRSWVRDLLGTAAQGSYIPIYGQILRSLASPNWSTLAIAITIVEAAVGLMILLGLFTRIAAAVGAFLGLNLTLTFSFCNCPWTSDFQLVFWFYFAPTLLNVQLIFDQSSNIFGLQKILKKSLVSS